MTVTEPGIYADIPEVTYHADPALSQSAAKVLLDCPARYRWQLDNPPPFKGVFDFGHAAHAKVLGVGLDLVIIDAPDWRTKAAQEAKAEAHATGRVPLLRKDAATVDAMAARLEAHDGARAILTSEGMAEQSMWWLDEQTGIECRGRIDWLAEVGGGLAIVDYKTTGDASPDGFAKSVANYGYRLQAAHYIDGLAAITSIPDAPFVFIAQEKEPPHLVGLYTLADYDVQTGRDRMRTALDLLAHCRAHDEWPGYSPDIQTLTLPRWAA